MDAVRRRRLEAIALARAAATRDDEEKWSFVFQTEGATSYRFLPFSAAKEFDGDLEGLTLSWEPDRVAEIEAGEDLTPEEFAEWRRAYCERHVETNSDWVWLVWIVPIRIDGQIEAYATFFCQQDDPALGGVYDAIEEAEANLTEQGALKPSD